MSCVEKAVDIVEKALDIVEKALDLSGDDLHPGDCLIGRTLSAMSSNHCQRYGQKTTVENLTTWGWRQTTWGSGDTRTRLGFGRDLVLTPGGIA